MKPIDAYNYAISLQNMIKELKKEGLEVDIPQDILKKLEEIVYKKPKYAFLFAMHIEGANIEKCKEAAYKDPDWGYYFARDIEREMQISSFQKHDNICFSRNKKKHGKN